MLKVGIKGGFKIFKIQNKNKMWKKSFSCHELSFSHLQHTQILGYGYLIHYKKPKKGIHTNGIICSINKWECNSTGQTVYCRVTHVHLFHHKKINSFKHSGSSVILLPNENWNAGLQYTISALILRNFNTLKDTSTYKAWHWSFL